MSNSSVRTIHGRSYRALYTYDDGEISRNPGWYVEYCNAAGDVVDDSQKIWHPELPSGQSPKAEAEVRATAKAYLAHLARVGGAD